MAISLCVFKNMHACVCYMCSHADATTQMRRSEDNTWQPVFSFTVSPRDQSQVIRLAWQVLLPTELSSCPLCYHGLVGVADPLGSDCISLPPALVPAVFFWKMAGKCFCTLSFFLVHTAFV